MKVEPGEVSDATQSLQRQRLIQVCVDEVEYAGESLCVGGVASGLRWHLEA